MKVVWEPSAHRTLGAAIAWWIQADARGLPAFLTELAAAIAQLERFPLSGPPWRETQSFARRSLIVGPYRLIYAVSDEAVHIGLLQHVRRGPRSADLTLLP